MNVREVAINFYEWMIDHEHADRESFERDIDEMIEDFTVMKRETPKMFNLLRDISDR